MRHSTAGRPRRVTDGDIAEILRWHHARETQQQLAARLGLSRATVSRVMRSRGTHYKRPSPEEGRPRGGSE
jgi:IS30 family transposase